MEMSMARSGSAETKAKWATAPTSLSHYGGSMGSVMDQLRDGPLTSKAATSAGEKKDARPPEMKVEDLVLAEHVTVPLIQKALRNHTRRCKRRTDGLLMLGRIIATEGLSSDALMFQCAMGAQSWQEPLPMKFQEMSGVFQNCIAAEPAQMAALEAALLELLDNAKKSFSKAMGSTEGQTNLRGFSCMVATLSPAKFVGDLLDISASALTGNPSNAQIQCTISALQLLLLRPVAGEISMANSQQVCELYL
jgi:hypothetical protein